MLNAHLKLQKQLKGKYLNIKRDVEDFAAAILTRVDDQMTDTLIALPPLKRAFYRQPCSRNLATFQLQLQKSNFPKSVLC